MSEACKHAKNWPEFTGFVKWWNTDFLSSEDWCGKTTDDGNGKFPSLAEKIVKALYWCVKKHHKRGVEHAWMLPFVQKVVEITDGDWTPYYLAKLAAWFNAEVSGVKESLVPLVKAKQREFWAWLSLAECTVHEDEKMAFYSRAVVTPSGEEDYKVELYHQFALFLERKSQHGLCSLIVSRYIEIQTRKKKSIDVEISAIRGEIWFESTLKDNLDERLHQYAEEAGRFLFKDHPWTKANFIEILPSNDGRPPLAILLIEGKGNCKIRNRCSGRECPERGTAINVKLFWPPPSSKPVKQGEPPHSPPLGEIYDWESRQDGKSYDCANKVLGVVSQVDPEKGFVRLAFSARSFGLLYYDSLPISKLLKIGDVVTAFVDKPNKIIPENRVRIHNFEVVGRQAVRNLYHEFNVKLEIRPQNNI